MKYVRIRKQADNACFLEYLRSSSTAKTKALLSWPTQGHLNKTCNSKKKKKEKRVSETTVKKKSKIQNGQGKSICEREASNKKFHTHRDPKTLEKKKECISPFFLCSHVPMTYFPSIGKKKKKQRCTHCSMGPYRSCGRRASRLVKPAFALSSSVG